MRPNKLGRSEECQISLPDPLCSRVHSEVWFDDGRWKIRDVESRNGTYVNGQKIDEAVIDEGHNIRVGSVEFEFHLADNPPTLVNSLTDSSFTQTIVRDAPVVVADTGILGLAAIRDAEQAKQMLRALSAQHQTFRLRSSR